MDEDYQWVRDEGLTRQLDPLQLGLVLAGQPLGHFEEALVGESQLLQPKLEKKVVGIEAVVDVKTDAVAYSGVPADEVARQTRDATAMEVYVVAVVAAVLANSTLEE